MSTNIDDIFGGMWLVAADLQGRSYEMEMASAVKEQMRDGKAKLALKFTKGTKGLLCNKTNGGVIARAYGKDYSKWPGNKITLFPDTTLYQGQLVACIRVRTDQVEPIAPVRPPVQPDPRKKAGPSIDDPMAGLDDDIPF